MTKSDNVIPRRNQSTLNVPAEIAIQNALWEVEKIGADVRLTEAVVFLAKQKIWCRIL